MVIIIQLSFPPRWVKLQPVLFKRATREVCKKERRPEDLESMEEKGEERRFLALLGEREGKIAFDLGEDIWPVKKQNNCRKINHFSEMRKKGWEIKGGRRILVIGYNTNLSDYPAPTGQGRNMVGGKKAEAADTVLTKMYTLQ